MKIYSHPLPISLWKIEERHSSLVPILSIIAFDYIAIKSVECGPNQFPTTDHLSLAKVASLHDRCLARHFICRVISSMNIPDSQVNVPHKRSI